MQVVYNFCPLYDSRWSGLKWNLKNPRLKPFIMLTRPFNEHLGKSHLYKDKWDLQVNTLFSYFVNIYIHVYRMCVSFRKLLEHSFWVLRHPWNIELYRLVIVMGMTCFFFVVFFSLQDTFMLYNICVDPGDKSCTAFQNSVVNIFNLFLCKTLILILLKPHLTRWGEKMTGCAIYAQKPFCFLFSIKTSQLTHPLPPPIPHTHQRVAPLFLVVLKYYI